MYEKELDRDVERCTNVWMCNGKRMRISEIRNFAKANGLKVRTEKEGHGIKFRDGRWSDYHTGRVFLIYPNKDAAVLSKLGQVVEPTSGPVRIKNEYQYIVGDVEKWVPANWHNRLQGKGRGRYGPLKSVKYRGCKTIITGADFTGKSRQVEHQIGQIS